jgi:ATP-dependent DNA helicase PIF1
MQLSNEQQEALEKCSQGENIFITGPGGSGKSELIRHIVQDANSSGKSVQVCALTGCATVLLQVKGAKTLHSWSGIGLAREPFNRLVERVSKNKIKRNLWKQVDVLIVDEVSMMSQKLFDILDAIARKVRKNSSRFGGIQLVFSGDFYQLPPVGTPNEPESIAFCFESNNWNSTFDSVIELKTIFRQTDPTYAKILNKLRIGKISQNGYDLLMKCVSKSNTSQLKPTILLPRKKNVDEINIRNLSDLSGQEIRFEMQNIFEKARLNEEEEYEIKFLRNNIMAEQSLLLKIGTQVMCVANIDTESETPLVNGTQGIVCDFRNGLPLVKFYNGLIKIVGYHTWQSENIAGMGVKQIPLIYAWAVTIHKSQGLTIDLAEIDAGSSVFECGQTYVALSRVKTIDGLYLKAFDVDKIKVNKKVKKYYHDLSVSPVPK